MRHLRPDGKRERGQIIVLFELILIVILGFAAIVIDLGVLRNNRQILVNTMDAAALAGGSKMPVDGPAEASLANALIDATIQADYPGLSGYTITYRCLVGVNPTTNQAWISRDIPGVCDPHNALHHTPPLYAVDTDFTGAGPTRISDCRPDLGDKCNTVVVAGTAVTHYALAPVVGVDQGSTGVVVAAACKGACGASPVVPVDLVIILDRTGSMADGSNDSGPKIQALQAAANTVLKVYDPAKQRVALALTGPGAVDASGNPASGSCPSGGSALGVGDDGNFSPSTTLTTTGNTNLAATPTGSFLRTTLTTAMTNLASNTTVRVTSATGFPTTNPFTIQIDNEQMRVTAGAGTLVWTVTRGYNSTTRAAHAVNAIVGWGVNGTQTPTDTSIRVASAAGFPTSGNYTILVDSEQMLVTAGQGTTTWTVTRGYGGTTMALHGGNETVSFIYSTSDTSIRVNSASGFPTSGSYTILVDSEHMLVTAGQGTTTWTVTRARDGTSAATHTGGAAVTRVVGTTDTTIQVNAPHGPGFPSVPFMIAVAPTSGSAYEHMLVTAVSGSSAPYTWTLASIAGVRTAQDGTPAVTHNSGATVDGVAPWVPSDATVGVWMPVGLSGTDTETVRALPNPTGANGTYSIGGVVQDTPLARSINCIQAFSNGTNLTTPIQMAQWYLDHYGRVGVTQGIILETDGHPQVGFESGDQTTTNSAYTCQAAADAAVAAKADTTNSPDGIQLFTIGYGVDSSSKCPTYTTSSSQSNGSYNKYETSTWSGKPATTLLSTMATDAAHYFYNPTSAELAGVFTQAATILAKGGAHLIQLNPKPIVTGVSSGGPSVTISGKYFTGATQVMFGSVGASIGSIGDSSITVTAPSRPSGTVVHVTVTTAGGTSAVGPPDLYTYP